MEDFTEEQVAELKEKAVKVEELEKYKNESEVKLKEYEDAKVEWEKKEAEYKSEANPNWQKARKAMETMRNALKEKGVETDGDGNVLSNPQGVDVEKIRQEASQRGAEAARQELTGNKLGTLLERYEEGSRDVIKHYFNKLTQGEQVTLNNTESFFNQAVSAASTNPDNKIKKALQFSGGQGPRVEQQGEIDPGRRQELGEALGFKFAKKSKENK